ncbi:MAG: polyphosphate kinase 1 [Gemmatimonadales bacterium]
MNGRPVPAWPREFYLNRELSWLEFNARVLEEARDPSNPLLERLKFLAIFSGNLDEFFEVRVAGLQQQLYAGLEPQDFGADGMGPAEQLAAIDHRAHELVAEQYRVLREDVLPGLATHGVRWVRYVDLTPDERRHVDEYFRSSVYPVLTPLAIDPGHPFPHVHNKSLNVVLLLAEDRDAPDEARFGVVQVPSVLDRVMVLPGRGDGIRFLLLEDLISTHLPALYPGFTVAAHSVFRVTRNTDLTMDEDEAEDLLQMMEESLRQRIRGEAVRLGIQADADERFVQMLQDALGLQSRDVYRVDGPVDLTAMMALLRLEGFRELRDEPLVPRQSPAAQATDLFEVIRTRDVLLHHPYESFGMVIDLIERAADDPQVLAIKQTLYRTSAPSPIISALARAAQNGKQVTALVELKARFDEQNNIHWARSLEEAGVHVVYGVLGLKTHCKALLIVRREPEGIRRYVHLSTGNYNPTTARLYTDVGLFTADPAFGEDATQLFNLLTGYARSQEWRKLIVAPVHLRERVIHLIDRERENAIAGRPARVIVKMNALVEPSVIDALYRASQGGVRVDLMIRGICCLRPGIPGVSANIQVRSVVDRFLEHARIFYFENDGHPEVFLGSADWMQRNFFRRIETMFPVEDPRLRQRLMDEILSTCLADDVKARELMPDGTYRRVAAAFDALPVRSQSAFQDLARDAGRARQMPLRQSTPIQRRPSTVKAS